MRREARRKLPIVALHRRPTAVVLLTGLLLAVGSESVASDQVRLECAPRSFRVVPGEPMRLELTVRAVSADPITWNVPSLPRLKLRAVEKFPVHRTDDGVVIHRRVLVWQALEPGTVKLKALSIETRRSKWMFPEVSITVRDPGP